MICCSCFIHAVLSHSPNILTSSSAYLTQSLYSGAVSQVEERMAREARELEDRAKQAAIEDQQVTAQLLTHHLLYHHQRYRLYFILIIVY